jgi:hypothetical protein
LKVKGASAVGIWAFFLSSSAQGEETSLNHCLIAGWIIVQSKTRIKLGATAGLRLLPGDQADKILEAVKAYFAQQPFILDPKDGVTILDGTALFLVHRLGWTNLSS